MLGLLVKQSTRITFGIMVSMFIKWLIANGVSYLPSFVHVAGYYGQMLVSTIYGKLLLACICVLVVIKFLQELFSEFVGLRTWLTDLCASRDSYPDYRKTFKACRAPDLLKHGAAPHSHLKAATDRCERNCLGIAFAKLIGSDLYSVSMSKSERSYASGNHYYYNAKDLQFEGIHNEPQSHFDLIQMVDVDYYLNMESYMTGYNIIVSTFVPEKASGSTTDSMFSIDEDDTINMVVNGGATYTHKLWDYDNDHIMVDHWWGSCLYLVEARTIGDQHRVVFLNCVRVIYGPIGWFLPGNRLKRRKFNFGGIIHVKNMVGSGLETNVLHSLSYPNSYSSVQITDASWNACRARYAINNGKGLQLSDVERILRNQNEVNPALSAPLVFILLVTGNASINKDVPIITKSVTTPEVGYQTLEPLVYEQGKATSRVLFPPLLTGAFAPHRSFNNDNACINGRIKNVANKVTKYAPNIWIWLEEFVDLLIPDDIAHTLAPHDYDYMYGKFNRPTQRSLMERAKNLLFMDRPWFIKAFQKSEFYGKATNPRNISTLPIDHNIRLGQYSYSFVENVMKQQRWYAFSKTPKEIEARMQELVQNYRFVVPTDISKCDGSRGYIHYCLDISVMMRAFGRDYHEEINRLLAKEAHAKGTTGSGLSYECDYNTLSGSSKTSWGNTLTNVFNNYVALRHTMDKEQAWNALGLYGGDDGVSVGIDGSLLETAFAKLGMLLKAELINQGSPVPFLGRIYLDPWTTPESIIDVKRQMSKLHATVSPMIVPDHVCLWRKADGYQVNDAQTPIIGEYIRMIHRCVMPPSSRDMERYEYMTKNEVNWWARSGSGTFTELTSYDLAAKVVAESLDITGEELNNLRQGLDNITDLKDIKKLTIKREENIEIDICCDGEIKQGVPPKNHQEQVKTIAAKPMPKVKTSKIPILKQAFRTQKEDQEKPFSTPVKLCRFAKRGEVCTWGKNCKFSHAVPAVERKK